MSKNATIIKMAFQRSLTYRFDIVAYRFGDIAEMLIVILMWSAIYQGNNIIGGYTLPEMLTYLLIGNLISVAIRNFLYEVVARDIKEGLLTTHILKPISYFRYILVREIGRIGLVTILAFTTQLVITLFFLDRLKLNSDPIVIITILIMVALSFIIEMFISYLTGLITFGRMKYMG